MSKITSLIKEGGFNHVFERRRGLKHIYNEFGEKYATLWAELRVKNWVLLLSEVGVFGMHYAFLYGSGS